jgi:hypothetical protein
MSGLFFEIIPATTYFPTTESCSIIGSNRLNFRVRDGNGCDPTDTITGKLVCRSPYVSKGEILKLDVSPLLTCGLLHKFSKLISKN